MGPELGFIACSLDVKPAFDNVSPENLSLVMKEMGIDPILARAMLREQNSGKYDIVIKDTEWAEWQRWVRGHDLVVPMPQVPERTVEVIHMVLQERISPFVVEIVLIFVSCCGDCDSGGASGTQAMTLFRGHFGSRPFPVQPCTVFFPFTSFLVLFCAKCLQPILAVSRLFSWHV